MANNEVKVTFKAFNKEFNSAIKGMEAQAKKLRQEMKLQQEQMKHTGSDTDRLKAQLSNLEKQYELAQKKTQATAEQLEKAKRVYGENSDEAARLESQLKSNQIAEQQLANKITETADSLSKAEAAERDRISESTKAAQKLDELKTKEDQLKSSTEKLNAEYELQKAKLGNNASEADKFRLKVDHLGKQHDLAKQQVKNYEEQLEQAKIKYGENSSEIDKYETQLLEARTAEQQLANEIEIANQKLAEQENKALQAGKKLGELGQKMKDIGKDLSMKLTAPIVALGAGMLNVGMDFEASMSNVQAISGATGKDFDALSDKARELGAKTSKSASEAADALGYMALAGWDTEQMLGGLEPILRLSEAGAIDLGRASDLVTDSMAALQLEVSDLPGYLDKVAQASRKSNTDIDALMEAFLISGGTFANFNVPVEEASALLGVLANRGFKASEAGTAMNAIMSNLTSGAGQAGKALKKMGISAFDANGDFKGMEVVLGEVRGKLEKMNDKQRAQYITMIAGKEHMKTFNALMAGLGDEYQDLKDDIIASDGALEDMAKTMQDNAKGKLTELKSALEELSISFSSHIIPFVTKFTVKLTGLVQKFGEMSPATQKTIIAIAGVAAAIGPLLVVAGSLASSISAIATLFGTVSGAIAVVTTGAAAATPAVGALATAFTVLTGPVGLIVAGLAAVGVGAYFLAKELKKPALETKIFGDEVSEATQKAVGSYLDLDEKASVALNQLAWSQSTVTKEMASELTGTYKEMSDQILGEMKKGHEEQLNSTQDLFAQTKTLTDQEKAEALEKLKQSQEQEQLSIKEGQERIKEILNTAKNEKRAITEAEKLEIDGIQRSMKVSAVKVMSESEAEQKAILESLKTEATKISAEQSAQVVKNSVKQKDKVIKEANDQYNKSVAEIIRLRDETGAISAEQAEKMITEAKKQRDGVVKEAEDTHQKVVSEAKKQAGEHVNKVDWETGQILSKWEVFKNNASTTWKLTKAAAKKYFGDLWKDTKQKFTNTKNDATKRIEEMRSSTTRKFGQIVSSGSKKFLELKSKITTPINDAKAKVGQTVDKIKGFFTNMKLKLPKIQVPKLPKFSLKGKFSLMPPSVPKLSVSWNALGGIFKKPTIFNTANAGLQGVGEAGPEAILPLTDRVLGTIGEMIANTMPNQQQKVIVQAGDVYIDGKVAGRVLWKPVKENIDRNTSTVEMFRG